MSVVAFFSAKGAPGTTTAAMLAASLWQRPALLADCDPAGGDMGLRVPAADGSPLDLGKGMLSLLPAARRSLEPQTLLSHAQQVLGGGELLVGLAGPEQATAAGPVWSTIAAGLSALPSHDVIIDLGRLDAHSPVMPLASAAALAVCVLDSSLSGVYSARARLRTLLPALRGGTGGTGGTDGRGGGPAVGLVVRSKDRREADIAASLIRSEFADVAYLGQVATDPAGAGIFDSRPVSRPERTLLVRSGAEVVAAMQAELTRLGIEPTPTASSGSPDSSGVSGPSGSSGSPDSSGVSGSPGSSGSPGPSGSPDHASANPEDAAAFDVPRSSDLLEPPVAHRRAGRSRFARNKRSHRSRRGGST